VVAQWPPGNYSPPVQHKSRRKRVTALSALTIALALAALIVGIVALVRPAASSPPSLPALTEQTSTSTTATVGADSADRQLCEAVGPLLRESNETGKAFVNLGETGTPARDAGIPGYEASVLDWIKRIQPVLDRYPSADPYLRRMLQRMVDDIHSFATSIRPGPSTDPDSAAWNDATVAYGGPYDVCHRLGVQW
jgi:hypothetical protein